MTESSKTAADLPPIPPVSWRPITPVLGAVAGLLLLTAGRYGYHRDELYFLAGGHHLAWGYPDQGPMVPLLARAFDALGGGSLVVFRVPAVLCAVGTTLVSALLARELGGRAFAQGLTAVVVGLGGFVLAVGHLLATSSVDVLVWTTAAWLVVRILRTHDGRLWLLVGVVLGLGLLNKALPEVLLGALFVSLLMVPSAREQLRYRWFWLGALVALVISLPYVWWQASHGWPQIELSREISDEYSAPAERIGFLVLQLLMFGPAGLWLWVTGAVALWRRRSPYRVLAWTWLSALVVFVATAGQGYYTAGTYPALIAAGAVSVERWVHRRALVLALATASAAVSLPAFVPVLPAGTLAGNPVWSGLAENQLETVGWPDLVAQVADAYDALPAEERAHAAIVTQNYGEAGAVDRFGPPLGLPPAYSGHNAYGLWGHPPANATTVVAVFEDGAPRLLEDCRRTAAVRNAADVPNEESNRAAVYVCRAPAPGWQQAWPGFVHLSA